ncbi:alpha/beta hydrolase fold [Rhizoctonia solani]|uniref:Alpha/beta hydrolase fold n=1 Tax=Rhizoctonia solani TaxID=456999 RepID=A0A8H7IHY4_9AGAM|nr:alpha/beta hydrolase fold [Rhizoctonia solani]
MTEVKILEDVEYGKDHPAQKLDVYLPPADVALGPVTVVWIHGGAWRRSYLSEDKADYKALALKIVEKSNCPVVAVNYRLSPRKEADGLAVRHPRHTLDVLDALIFIQEHGSSQLGIPQSVLDNIYLVGHSCGAHIIASIILDTESELYSIPTPSSLITSVKGVFISEGIYDIDLLLTKFPQYSDFIENAFGKLSSYKDGDRLVNEQQAEEMWDHLWELYDDKSAHQYIEADWERLKLDHNEMLGDDEYPSMVAQFIRETVAKRAVYS